MARRHTGSKRNLKGTAYEFKQFSIKQLQLLNWWRDGSPYKDRAICIADGAIRSGKTIAMIASFLQFAMENFKGRDFIIAGRSVGSLKRNVVSPLLQILRAWGWPYYYNRSENFIVIETNTFYLFGANTEASYTAIQGMTAAGALADEAALFPRSFVEQMLGRCSVAGSKVFMNCNPEGPFHYLKTEYIDKAEKMNIYHVHFMMDDNLTLDEEIKERFRRLFSGVFYARYILGKWQQAEGLIYSMFTEAMLYDDADLPDDFKENAIRYIGVDYGTTNPCVFLDIYDDGNSIWINDEYYWDSRDKENPTYQKEDSEYVADMAGFVGARMPRKIIVDPSAESFRVALKKRGYPVREADNSVKEGIQHTATMMVTGRLHINRRCKNLLKELGTYSWDEKLALKGEEKPIKVNDHACDALRYVVETAIETKRVNMYLKNDAA